jgi:hypothetical protein
MATPALSTDTARGAGLRTARDGWLLRFATIRVDQFRGRPTRQSDVRPILCGVAGLEGWADHARRDKLVETTSTAALARGSWRNEFRDDTAVSGDGDALPGFDSADVPAEIVFQLTNARRRHLPNIATYGHISKRGRKFLTIRIALGLSACLIGHFPSGLAQ